MQYGMNRVPRDVDATSETKAEREAAQMAAEQMTALEAHILRDWRCTQCGSTTVYLPLYRSGRMGSRSLCAECWLDYQHHMTASAVHTSQTVDEALAWYAQEDAREAQAHHRCLRCGQADATWNTGAGAYLCRRDWDNY